MTPSLRNLVVYQSKQQSENKAVYESYVTTLLFF
jgi:hypothetical protein